MTGRKPRQKTSSIDYLASLTSLKYDDFILRSLASNLGLKMTTELIKHCLQFKEAAKDLWLPRCNNVLESKKQLYINLSFLQSQASIRCQSLKSIDTFYMDCDKILQTYKEPVHMVPTDDYEALIMEDKNVEWKKCSFPPNEVKSYTLGMTQWVCFILSSMASLSNCRLMVQYVNKALLAGKLEWYLKRQMMLTYPKEVHSLVGLAHILKDAIAFHKNEEVNERIDREFSMEVDKMIKKGCQVSGSLDHIISLADKDGNVKWGDEVLYFEIFDKEEHPMDKLFNKEGLSQD